MDVLRDRAAEAKSEADPIRLADVVFPRCRLLDEGGATAVDSFARAAHIATLHRVQIIGFLCDAAMPLAALKGVDGQETSEIATRAQRVAQPVHAAFAWRRIGAFSGSEERGGCPCQGSRDPRRRRYRLAHQPQVLEKPKARAVAERARIIEIPGGKP